MTSPYKHMNYFGENEQKRMMIMAGSKTKFFKPILELLKKLGFTPNIISLLGFFCILMSAYFVGSNTGISFLLLILHIIFDGLDGSLARYLKIESNAGAFVDIVVDQSGVIVICLALILYQYTDPFFTTLYLITYIVMIVFLIYANSLGKPLGFVIRTKYVCFLLVGLLYLSQQYGTIGYEILFKVFSIYQLGVMMYLFFIIQGSLQ